MKPQDTEFQIITDSREQKPLTGFKRETVVKGLETGDYSIEEYEECIAIEHKSIKDLIGTCGHQNRERFQRELLRFNDSFDFYCIVVSGRKSDILPACQKLYKTQYRQWLVKKKRGIKCRPPMRPEVRAKSVEGTLRAWRVDFNAHYYFCQTREGATEWIEQQFEYFMRHKGK